MNLMKLDFKTIINYVDIANGAPIGRFEQLALHGRSFNQFKGLRPLMETYIGVVDLNKYDPGKKEFTKPCTADHMIYIYDSINTEEIPCERCKLPFRIKRNRLCSFCRQIDHQHKKEAPVWIEICEESVNRYAGANLVANEGDAYAFWWVENEEDKEGYLVNYEKIVALKNKRDILDLIRTGGERVNKKIDKSIEDLTIEEKIELIRTPHEDRSKKNRVLLTITSTPDLIDLYDTLGGSIMYYEQFRKSGMSDREIFELFKDKMGKHKFWTPALFSHCINFFTDLDVLFELSEFFKRDVHMVNRYASRRDKLKEELKK